MEDCDDIKIEVDDLGNNTSQPYINPPDSGFKENPEEKHFFQGRVDNK